MFDGEVHAAFEGAAWLPVGQYSTSGDDDGVIRSLERSRFAESVKEKGHENDEDTT
jgi:hypothetical protein